MRSDSRFLRLCLLVLPILSAFMWIGESKSNAYAVGEYFLTYKHGFLKRALIGELLSHFGPLSTGRIQTIEFASVLLAVVVSYAVLWRLLSGPLDRALLAAALLCSPACLPHFGNLAAQPDTLLFVLLLAAYFCLLRLPGNWAPFAALVPCALALFVHEGFLLLFYPLVLTLLWDGYRNGRFARWPLVVHLAFISGIFLWIMRNGKIHMDPLVLMHEAEARSDFPWDFGIFIVLNRSFHDQWVALLQGYNPVFVGGILLSLLLLVPVFFGVWRIALHLNGARSRPLPVWGLVALFGAPLCLVFLGQDAMRWLAGSVIGLILFSAYSAETEPEAFAAAFPAVRQTTIGVLLYGFAVGPMGGASVRILIRALEMVHL